MGTEYPVAIMIPIAITQFAILLAIATYQLRRDR